MTLEQYITKFFDLKTAIKDTLLLPDNPSPTRIITRYVTSTDIENEDWRGFLADEVTDKVDIWLMTFVGVQGVKADEKGIGYTTKPITVLLDYFLDYRQGTDSVNSETVFLTKALTLDYRLETLPYCLLAGAKLTDYRGSFSLKRFTSDTAHRASFVLNFRFDALQINN